MAKKPRSKRWRWLAACAVLGFAVFGAFVHPFLAINRPVNADVMVVEGWAAEYDYVLTGAVREFNQGVYIKVLVSGLSYELGDKEFTEGSDAARGAKRLAALGLEPSRIEAAPSQATDWNRTSSMAIAVAARVRALGLKPKGVNVITVGPHARQTLLAYERAFGAGTPVGVISIPKDDYNPSFWWASSAGIKKTTKDFAGWVKEVLFGRRS